MNILFIMYDQLRFDYLSCSGHPHLQTPNFDRVASMGVQFNNAYVQSPICGSSRMCFYTGRYASSHGAHWNGFPLRVGELTLGDHLRANGMACHLIGKTHMKADADGLARLGLKADSIIGVRQSECGFDPWIRDDGLWAEGPDGFYDSKSSPYNNYLKSKGYDGTNPWADYANASVKNSQIATGWMFDNTNLPANIREEDSETPWLTNEAIKFMDQNTGPWCAHLSYIKPHWPYIVPMPYASMFGSEHIQPATKALVEKECPHPVFEQFMQNPIGQAFQDENVRQKVIPAYMGLIKQCDDQLGRLLDYLEQNDKLDTTMIVLTSDHGDYLGDHWLGEKNLFHDPSVKIPLIIYDPREAAGATRGTVCNELVESIDLASTFIDVIGGQVPDHIVEGRSLVPFLIGEQTEWREYVISEYDFSAQPIAKTLELEPRDCRIFMVFDGRYKLMHCAASNLRSMLFDLQTDPDELIDLGKDLSHEAEIARLTEYLHAWGLRMSQRVTKSDVDVKAMRGASLRKGILPFLKDGSEVEAELIEKYKGPARQNYLKTDE
ncbi:sulfatase-like hydrolase/transferase [Tateyamaria sp.]|nr:sulfatase-like hydrolase/transferase [Tateyamaria sp.]